MSCPGLSVRGKEGESVTPQERAAELCFKLALLVDADTHMEVDQDAMKAITEALTATRRAALLEAVQQLREGARLAQSREVANALSGHAYTIDRLAQEG